MENKTILITGATGSIGKATAIDLAKQKCRLILVGRNETRLSQAKQEISAASGNKEIEVVVADLAEPDSVKSAISKVKQSYQALDAIINVAAVYKKDRAENSKGHEYMLAANHLGPFLLTNGLIDLVKKSKGRVVTVSAPSTTKINFDDIHWKKKFSPGFLGSFGSNKMMNLVFTYGLARKLEGTGATATVMHPGLVKSELTSEMPAFMNWLFKSMSSPPDKAARGLSALAVGKEYAGHNGKFYKFDGKELKSSKYSYDTSVQDRLWKISEELTA
jgi:retinol dehydrogenase-14